MGKTPSVTRRRNDVGWTLRLIDSRLRELEFELRLFAVDERKIRMLTAERDNLLHEREEWDEKWSQIYMRVEA